MDLKINGERVASVYSIQIRAMPRKTHDGPVISIPIRSGNRWIEIRRNSIRAGPQSGHGRRI